MKKKKGQLIGNQKVADLTKREYFAGLVMQGLYACPNIAATRDKLATESVSMADALLEALTKEATEL